MKNFRLQKILLLTIVLTFITVFSVGRSFADNHKTENYQGESWDDIMKELHAHVEELVDFANEGNLKQIAAIVPEVTEHAQELVEASQKEHNKEGVTYGKKIEETAPEILQAAQAGDKAKIKVRLADINKFVHKIMASNPTWIVNEMHVHIAEMRSSLNEGDMGEVKNIAMETYGHMTDLATYLTNQGNTSAAKTSKESRNYMKEVKKGKNISGNIAGFETILNKLAKQI